MGTNFHTAYIDDTTAYKAADMNSPLSDLDKAISYAKNVIVHTDGSITYNKTTGQLTWASTIRILFNREDGKAIQNTIAAGNVTLADNQFAYVDLNETNDTVLTVSVATITTDAASNFLAVARLVMAYRNTASDDLFLVALKRADFNDVVGPASAVDENFCQFNGTTGKIIKDSGLARTDVDAGRIVCDDDQVVCDNNEVVTD